MVPQACWESVMSTMVTRDDPMQALRALTRIMDEAVRIPGTRFRVRLDAFIGLIPWAGDMAGAAITGFTILTAHRMGAPPVVLLNMVVNLGIDALVGAIPFLGDIFDFGFKSNRPNLDLLERHLQHPAETRRSSRGVLMAVLGLLILMLIGMVWLAAAILQA